MFYALYLTTLNLITVPKIKKLIVSTMELVTNFFLTFLANSLSWKGLGQKSENLNISMESLKCFDLLELEF